MNLGAWQQDPLVRTVLENRARRLSAVDADTREIEGEEVLTFSLGQDGYSLPLRAVREVCPLPRYTPLPMAPEFVVGLVNLRGRPLAVLDIRPLLGIPRSGVHPTSMLLRAHLDHTELGLLIDTVVKMRYSDLLITPALPVLAGQGLPWVRGSEPQLNLLLGPALTPLGISQI